MLWHINTSQLDPGLFGDFTPCEILYEYDGPRIFTIFANGHVHFCYQSGEDESTGTHRYLVAPTDEKLLNELRIGAKTVYELLSQPWLWAVDTDAHLKPINVWRIDGIDSVPSKALPTRDATLWPHLMPLLSYRVIGEGLTEGNIPASVISRAVNNATAAIKRLLEIAFNEVPQGGRPEKWLRELYDLRAQRFAYNSFEVSFRAPTLENQLALDESSEGLYRGCTEIVARAANWLSTNQSTKDIDVPIAQAIKLLAPPATGQIQHTEIKGRLVAHVGVLTLSRSDTTRVSTYLQQRSTERQLLSTTGRIREFDKDKLSFILRDREDNQPDLSFTFPVELYEDVTEAFNYDNRTSIHAKWLPGKKMAEVIAIESLGGDSTSVIVTIP